MTFASTPGGLLFPNWTPTLVPSLTLGTTLNTATDKECYVGHLYWQDRAPSKTVSSAGGQIKFLASSATFASGSTTIDVGIQDVDATNGPVVRGDGTFDVKKTLTGGVDTITGGGAWNTINMATGSKVIAHSALVAVVVDMTARGGTDALVINGVQGPNTSALNNRPTITRFKTSAWGNVGNIPNVIIVADDGTIGILDGTLPFSTANSETFSDSSNPDERGLMFRVPWACKADALCGVIFGAGAAADITMAIYSDPTGTPAVVSGSSISVLGENFERNSSAAWFQAMLASEVELRANTDYCLALRGTGATNLGVGAVQLPDTNLRNFIPGGTTLKKVTRNNGSGAFSAESPATTMYRLAIRISQLHDGVVRPYSGLQAMGEGISQ